MMQAKLRVLAILLICLSFTGTVFGKSSTSTALRSSPNPSNYGGSVTFTATVTPSAATGTVTFKDGTTSIGSGTISGGVATLIKSTLAVGSHSITASYGGDTNYLSSTSSAITQTVNKAGTTVTLASSLNPSTFGASVKFTATLSPTTATGTVTFTDGTTTLGTGTIASGKVTYTLPTLSVGSHSIAASYGGDTNYTGSTSTALTQTVNKAASTVTLTSSGSPSAYGSLVTFTATLTPSTATGTVTFSDSGATLGTGTISGGVATFGISMLSVGTHSITAAYGGDSNDATSTSSIKTQAVQKAATVTTVSSSANPSTSGNSVTFTATVTPTNATGTVTFKNGTATLGTGTLSGGRATYATSGLTVGSHSITAVYGGDGNDSTSTSSVMTQSVVLASSVALSSSANPSTYGSSTTFRATLTPSAATGTVTFKDGSTVLGAGTISSGVATYSTSTLGVASHSITAVYGGDSNYAVSSSLVLTQVVNKVSTTITVASSTNPAAYGSSVTFTANVAPAAATGTVTFLDGGSAIGTGTVGSGTATLTTSALAVSSHSITASYGGDTNDTSSTSSVLTQVMNRATTTVTLTSSANPVVYGSSVTFTVAVMPSTATGTVTLMDGSTTLGTGTISNGTATYSSTSTLTGSHSITASYGGDTNDNSSTSSVLNQVVNAANTAVTLASSANPSAYGSPVTFTATVTPTTATGTVTFKDGSAALGSATLGGGVATYSTSALSAGPHSITAAYSGDSNDNVSTSSVLTQTITGTVQLNTSRYQHSATLLNNGKVLIAGGVNCPTPGSCTYLNSAELYDSGSGSSLATGSLGTARVAPSALLPNGKVLIAGGSTCTSGGSCASLSSAEIYDPTSGTFVSAGNMEVARDGHTMTLLPDGKVLIAGGETCSPSYGGGSENRPAGEPLFGNARLVYASFTPVVGSISCTAQGTGELYDPVSGSFSYTSGSLNVARYNAAAVQLADGRVLIVGGSDEFRPLWSAEIYEESAGSFSELASGLLTARSSPAATLLNTGLVLITGGSTCEAPICSTNTAELYDPTANAFHYTSGAMNVARVSHTANLLTNGQVLLAGGNSSCPYANSCTAELSTESYDPASGTFTSTQSLATARAGQSGTLLSNGSVLLAGGTASGTTLSSIELYQPSSLTPTGLVSIAVTPASGSMGVGGIQQFVGTGTFSDGSTSALRSVVWVSTNPAVASINNAAGSLGFAYGLSFGSTTITATAGTVSGSAALTVELPVQSGGLVTTNGQMQSSLYGQTATQLTTGQILMTGGMGPSGVVNGAELYTPASQTFAPATAMNVARWLHTSTLLNDGTILVAGGSDLANEETLDSAEIYNPATGTFTLLTSTLNTARVGHTATLLDNGQVLIVGGYDPQFGLIADAEVYDPPSQTFIDLGNTNASRYKHTATMLQNGQVLIAGGETDPIPTAALNQAEIFDQPSQTFKPVTAPMISTREGHAAVLLNNGQVLITGGDVPGTGSLNTAEIYDPTSSTFAAVTSLMTVPRISHAMTVLNGGTVLITGGATDSGGNSTALYAVESYDPASQSFAAVGDMASAREHQTASLLNDGTVLIAGGTDGVNIFNSAELYASSQLNGLMNIAVTPPASSIGAGAQQRFTAVGTFSNGSTQTLASVLWSSSSLAIAPISADATNPGIAASAAQGTTTVTARAAGASGSATLTVTAPTLVSITLSPQSATIPLGATQQFAATGVYTDGSTQDLTATATWSSSATVVAAINGSGLAAGSFQGTATIQVNSGSVSSSTTLTVGAAALVSITVTPATATIALGTSEQYQATGIYSDGSSQAIAATLLRWSSSAPTVAAVNNGGFVTTLSQGTTMLTVGFESFSTSANLTVGPPSLVSISVVPNAASLSVGATQQLSVAGIFTDGSRQNFSASSTWVSSNPSVISIGSTGIATAVAAGNATITATSQSMNGTAALVVTTGTIQANLNTSRYQQSAPILNNGQILVAGGVSCPTSGSCTYLSSAELYNPATSTFTNTGAMATARSAPAVLLNSGKVLIAGGYTCDGSGNCSILSSAEIYDPTAGSFSSAGTMTVARSGHTMTVLSNGTVLIAGGQNCNPSNNPPCSAMANSEIYDPVAGTFTRTANGMSAARYGASAVLLNSGSVLIAGGFDGTNFPAAAEIYNPTYYGTYGGFTGPGPNIGVPHFYGTATLLNNGQVLVAGGSTCALPGCPTNDAEIYDPVANTFSTVASGMNVPRFNHTATLTTNGAVVVAGGYSSCGSSCNSEASTEFFDPVAGTFTTGQPVAGALAEHTGTLLANSNVLLIGGINAGVTLASDEWYQPTSFTPTGLVSVTVAPASLFLMPGQNQRLVATGTFNDGSTQILQSVIWNSSNPSAAGISNFPGTAGVVNAQATGATTLTATAGDVGGSASVSVAGLASLAITPANPTITVGSGQQFTATGTFSDGSQQNVTTLVTWSSSNPSSVMMGSSASVQGFAMGAAVGTSTITATLGSTQGSTLATAQAPVTPIPPHVNTVSPPVGEAGTQVTISGTGFGTTQSSGTVWLGSTYAAVMNWTDTQIIATVASIARSGLAQVQQGGLLSNSVAFNVNTATILTVFPPSGEAGTQVTITGSNFGATQGSGQVFLGTASGSVQSWTDTQVVAIVAVGARSGNAQILQNGVTSNAVPFTVNSLHITSISRNSGGPGTSVTITGTGFGWNQGNGSVWLAGTNGQVVSWSNNQVVAVVAANAMTGVVRIEQNGVLSNALTFTVPTSNAVTLNPNMLNLVAGQTQTIQALNASGQPVTGLTWASSNPKVVSLSTDDPPVLTALTAGHVTITAGTASADVTVYSGTLPTGSVIWSNPGDGSGVQSIVPAVPSATGVADVFALNEDCNVQAIRSDGSVAWTANIGQTQQYSGNLGTCSEFLPDFQGGFVVKSETSTTQNGQLHFQYHLQKFDGMTGEAYPAYDLPGGAWISMNFQGFGGVGTHYRLSTYSPTVVHTDGTIFTIDGGEASSVVEVIDPLTGLLKAQIGGANGGFSNLIIAGDGYAYVAYDYTTPDLCPGINQHNLNLLRMDTSGGSSSIPLGEWTTSCTLDSGMVAGTTAVNIITNADQGVLVSWELQTAPYVTPWPPTSTTDYVAAVSGGSLIAKGTTAKLVQPVLQAQDGSFYGTDDDGMIKFDRSGNIQWSVPGDSPQIATVDGGVVGASGITYDDNGRATGQVGLPIQSWTQTTFQYGSVEETLAIPVAPATPDYASFVRANPSGSGTSPLCLDGRDQLIAQYGQYPVLDSFFQLLLGGNAQHNDWPRFAPNCFELATPPEPDTIYTPAPANFTFQDISTDGDAWALIKNPLVVPASSGYGLDEWIVAYKASRIINSGYRTPAHNHAIGGKPSSRHMLGDAVDLRNESCPQSGTPCSPAGVEEWQNMIKAAGGVIKSANSITVNQTGGKASWIEPQSGHCGLNCAHADWRYEDRGKYVH